MQKYGRYNDSNSFLSFFWFQEQFSPCCVRLIESDLFLEIIMDSYHYLIWPFMMPGEKREIYSVYEPAWWLSYAIPMWLKGFTDAGYLLTAKDFLQNAPYAEFGYVSEEELSAVLSVVVPRVMAENNLQPIIDIAKKYGLELVLVDSNLSDGEGRLINGLYKEGTNRIVLSLNSDFNLLLVTAGHEMFHWVKNQNPAMGEYLQDRVISVLESDSKYDFDGIYKQVSEAYEGLSKDDILEEIAAQYMAVALANEKTISRIVNEATETERSFLQKILDHLKDFIESVKELLNIYGSRDKTVRAAVATPVEQLEFLAELFEKALENVAKKKNPTTETGGVKASLKVIPTTDQINKNIELVAQMNAVSILDGNEFKKGNEDLITQVEQYFDFVGGKVSTVYGDIELRRRGIKSSIGHGIGRNKAVAFKAVPDVLTNGKIIDYQKNWKNRGYDTVVFAAPIIISGQEYFMATVVVVEATKNDYYLHEVLLQKKEDEALFKTGTAKSGTSGKASSPIFILLEKLNEVKKKYSVKRDIDGNIFVDVDPDLFDARDGESHAKTIARIIKDRFNNLISVNGQQIQINKTTNDEWRRSNGADALRKRNSTGYFDKLKTIPYADEILKTAKNWIGEELHHPRKDDIVEFARGNVYYRVGNNGYGADVIVAIRKNGTAVLYDLDDIRTKKITDASLAMASNNSQRSAETSVTDNISQTSSSVNIKYSRQLLSDTWDGIRDKMSEYAVHEDVIAEIEDYIKELSRRNLSREEAITGGFIPKYEAILKIAREYTKGSKVDAHQLADTINELMWAAHDGNLDTKQFIATVSLIAEDIIKTGSKVNDELYRQYSEFRAMTRAETVYVERRVYDQYVEEYGSIKNLNRAVAGKIKIRPYEDGSRTGRGLDDFYNELQEAFPGLLREETDVYHQLFAILDAWQGIQPWTEYYSDILGIRTTADLQHQALIVAEDILSDVLGIKETVKTLADKYADKASFQREHYKEHYRRIAEEGRRKRREKDTRNIVLKKIVRNTKRLDDMLRKETDQKHIPEELKEPVAKFLSLISLYMKGNTVHSAVNSTLDMVQLGRAYAAYGTDNSTNYDEDIKQWIDELSVIFRDELDIKELSLDDLYKVDKIVEHFSYIVNHENEMFVNGRREKFTSWANTSIDEMQRHVKKPEYKTEKRILDAEYGMLTPIYFFKTIGISTVNGEIQEEKLFRMFRDLQDGQDKWYRNIASVKNQLAAIKKKYHYSEDWKRVTTEFTLTSGVKIKLTAEEIMYMRALNIRETGHINRLCHLLEGGIIVDNDGRLRKFAEKKQEFEEIRQARKKFAEMKKSLEEKEQSEKDYKEALEAWKKEVTDALKKNITREDLIAIFATLTEEQERYSEALVEMLSTTGADLGNEVSMELFGIRKFSEKNYIPISVAQEYLQYSVDKNDGGEIRLKNRSFTKRTVQQANATVYVRSITDIAVEHMQEMSLYNAMTIPIENFTRVYNYQKPVQEEFSEDGMLQKHTGNSYKEKFKEVYGERGAKYFEDFLRDMNGGNQTPSRDFTSKMMATFKRSAVTGSLSVAIQQPSAVVRATALIDAKYFVPKLYSNADYEEMVKYNPVAGIKEIGRFDTGLGQTATEWILDDKHNFLDKADDFLSYLPGMMDRMTWVYIWNAIKKETRAKNKGLSEAEFFEKASERFRDVIDYTQVYDSTLSRSGYMRDQGTGAKMATAFLAEPTLSYNMVRDGMKNAKAAPKQAAKSISAFTGATLLNAILKSIITALRKDDDETNYGELYISQVVSNFTQDMNILNSLPFIKDIINIFRGYDVERPDMTLFSNFYNAAKVLNKEGHTPTWDEYLAFLGAVSAIGPIPLNNIIKDITAVIKTISGIKNSPEFSPEMVGYTLSEMFVAEKDDSVKLYRAIVSNNEKVIERYLSYDEKTVQKYMEQGYAEADAIAKAMDNAENSFHNNVIEGLISEDIRIYEAAEALLGLRYEEYEDTVQELIELGFDRNDVIKAVDKYISSLNADTTSTPSEGKDKDLFEYEDLHRAIEGEDIKAVKYAVNALKDSGKEDKNIRSSLTGKFKSVYIEYCSSGNDSRMQRLKDLLLECDVGYTDKTFVEWEKEYLKNK